MELYSFRTNWEVSGVWLGGRMYDFGDYTAVWWIGVGVGAFSAIIIYL